MAVTHRFLKRGILIPRREDMTVDDVIYLHLHDGCWCRNINKRANGMVLGVAHTKYSKCAINLRTLNWTFLPLLTGCLFWIATA